ncbi:MAG: bis(5'-nucleosyl)-tetraphosphatase (symmetrical) YqeK [Actinobacteria bacterium]|nr:bis(5'-nucleosyl)-tetraphosphatase (symmetrical) YqeK [Actinomycetota bacterium]
MDYINRIKSFLNENHYGRLISIDKVLKDNMEECLYRHTLSTLNYTLKLLDIYYFPGIFSMDNIIREKKKTLSLPDFIFESGISTKVTFAEFINKACLASILHDYGKMFGREELAGFASLHSKDLSRFERSCGPCIHAFVAPYLIKRDFGISDRDVLHAVKYHTTGSLKMNVLDRIIYISDKLESGRSYDNIENLRELSLRDPDLCLLEVYKSNIIYVINKNCALHPNTSRIWNYICGGFKNAT